MDKSYTESKYMPASRKDNQQEKVDSFFGKPGILSIANKCIAVYIKKDKCARNALQLHYPNLF